MTGKFPYPVEALPRAELDSLVEVVRPHTNTTPNVPMLRKLVEWVEAEEQAKMASSLMDRLPGKGQDEWWDQGVWVRFYRSRSTGWCATGCCAAGHIAVMEAKSFITSDESDPENFVYCRDQDDRVWSIPEFAAEQLGLLAWEQSAMFSGSNGAAGIREIAAEAAGRVDEAL